MSVPISNVTRRVVYAASGTGPYNFTFEILANTDIAVYKDDTLLTLTTDYTVTINANGTGYVTLVTSPTGATQISIVGNRSIERSTDFVTGGDFFAVTLNAELDQQTIFAQQNAEAVDRALKAPETDPTTINMVLPRAADRAGKNLAFDSQGNPTLGDTLGTNRGNWASGVLYFERDIVKDTSNSNIYQCLVQHTSSGAQPISTNTDSAKWFKLVDAAAAASSASAAATSATLAQDWATKTSGEVVSGQGYGAKKYANDAASSASAASSSASAASSSASSASTAKTAAETAQTAAEAARDQTLAVYDSFDDRYLGSKTSDPTVDNDGNALVAGTIYFNSSSGIMKLYTGSAWVAAYVQGIASSIGFTPTGGVAATTVQAAIAEVDSEKLAKASNLSDVASASTALSNLGGVAKAGDTMTGDLSFSGTGRRIKGDFSNATLANRTMVQNASANSATSLGVLPSGTAKDGNVIVYGGSDPDNAPLAYIQQTDTVCNIHTSKSGTGSYTPMAIATGGSERMRIDSSGNVGIGTSSPSNRLDVSQNTGSDAIARVYNANSGVVAANLVIDALNTTGANYNALICKAAGTEMWRISGYGTANSIAFCTGSSATERARIDSSGNLLVGTTSVGNANNNGISLSVGDGCVRPNHANGTPSGYAYMQFGYNGTAIGSITQNGTTATAYNTSSDYRLKHDIQPMTGALERIAELKPCTYKWNADDTDGEGFIAHELAEVCPHAVTGEKDAVETYVDEEGNEQTRPKYQGIDTSFLVATLTAAIQEQQAIIEQLRADVEALKAGA